MESQKEDKLIKSVPPGSPQRDFVSIYSQSTSGQPPKLKDDLKSKRKVYDNVHGFISFPERIWQFIDTPHFQRLRNIKQLSILHYVFPGANHTRFQHSLGTGYLAQTFIENLIENHKGKGQQYEDHSIHEEVIFTVTLAGLMHDLGHGPYSHTFDSTIVERFNGFEGEGQNRVRKQIDWKHQIASLVLFDHLVKDNHLEEIMGNTPEQVNRVIKRVKDLINGKRKATKTRPWQFDLISNQINGIDVDKFDYFRRDAFYMGAKNIHIDHELLMSEARILDDQICYPTKYAQKINDIFHSRYKLYKGFYYNIVSRGVQFMICDILKEVKDYFKFKEACELIYQNAGPYMKLNDNLIELIPFISENMDINDPRKIKFQNAVKIINKIHKRKIYKFVKEVKYYIPESKSSEEQKNLQEIEDLFKNKKKCISFVAKHAQISQDLLRVSVTDSGFGSKTENPLRKVGFFNKYLQNPKKIKQAEKGSMLFTNAFIQRSAKIYITEPQDTDLFSKVQNAFEQYCKTELNVSFKKYKLTVIYDGEIGKTPMGSSELNSNILQKSAEKLKKEKIMEEQAPKQDDDK